jgi:hypothetical protein
VGGFDSDFFSLLFLSLPSLHLYMLYIKIHIYLFYLVKNIFCTYQDFIFR